MHCVPATYMFLGKLLGSNHEDYWNGDRSFYLPITKNTVTYSPFWTVEAR